MDNVCCEAKRQNEINGENEIGARKTIFIYIENEQTTTLFLMNVDFFLFSFWTVKIQTRTYHIHGGGGEVISLQSRSKKYSQFIKLNQSNFKRNGAWTFLRLSFPLILFFVAGHSSTVASNLISVRIAVEMYTLGAPYSLFQIKRTETNNRHIRASVNRIASVKLCYAISLYNRFIFRIFSIRLSECATKKYNRKN